MDHAKGRGKESNILLLTLWRWAAFVEIADQVDHVPDVDYPVGIDIAAGSRGKGVVPAVRRKIIVRFPVRSGAIQGSRIL